jgi:hypothetical protein
VLTNEQKAQAVLASLEENSPQLLAQLAEKGELVSRLQDRVNRFNLEYVRLMKGQPADQDPMVEERLFPMLTEFPKSQNQKPLSRQQRELVQKQLDKYLASLPRPLSQPAQSR